MGCRLSLTTLTTLLVSCLAVRARLTCSDVLLEPKPEFHLVAPCSASGMNIIAKTSTGSVKRCSQFANLKRGLAFNYIPPGKQAAPPDNCLIYDCPEFDVLQSIRREKGFDYYSIYADPLPSENTTCVAGVGMFRLYEERANYTAAAARCREEGGELASVLTSLRTNGLSNLVSSMGDGRRRGLQRAYVGMDDIGHEGRFVSARGKLLSCYEFRAWAPGEPRNRRAAEDCVVVDSRSSWRVVKCSLRLPFICELMPKGPFPIPDRNVTNKCRLDLSNRKFVKRPLVDKDFYKKSIVFSWLQ